jgi:hypothetical protein
MQAQRRACNVQRRHSGDQVQLVHAQGVAMLLHCLWCAHSFKEQLIRCPLDMLLRLLGLLQARVAVPLGAVHAKGPAWVSWGLMFVCVYVCVCVCAHVGPALFLHYGQTAKACCDCLRTRTALHMRKREHSRRRGWRACTAMPGMVADVPKVRKALNSPAKGRDDSNTQFH